MRSRRFTLVELLVVIAIISILAAMLLPALGRARRVAQSSACQNNMKQISFMLVAYSDAWNDYYPSFTDRDSANQYINCWIRKVLSVMGYQRVYLEPMICPAHPRGVKNQLDQFGNYDNIENDAKKFFKPSYGIAAAMSSGKDMMIGDRPGVKRNAVKRPSLTVTHAEAAKYASAWTPTPERDGYFFLRAYFRADEGSAHPRHNDGGNFLWADGHVEYSPMPWKYWHNSSGFAVTDTPSKTYKNPSGFWVVDKL